MHFINGIDTILNHLSKSNIKIIICGDVNINYLAENCNQRQQLDNLLATYNLTSTIKFPTRIDNIFIDITHIGRYIVCPVINGLSDHDAHVIRLENIFTHKELNETKIIRNFDKYSIGDFKIKLSYETWDNIFSESDVNKMYNKFHNT
jgi:hypothetical protein